jgi:hypothetical protein
LVIHLGMLFISINIMALLLFILELKKIKEKII